MNATLTCRSPRRRDELRSAASDAECASFNGLDYVEVSDDFLGLQVTFICRAPTGLRPKNFHISGGTKLTDVSVVDVGFCRSGHTDLDDCLLLTLNHAGDSSRYELQIVALDADGDPTPAPPSDIDPRYAAVSFWFTANCPSELDCLPVCDTAISTTSEPAIDYLAKDYSSFRRLLFDRLSVLTPEWRESHVADLGVALLELLAYEGDRLSYFQDAVATEAYLDTAQQRTSIRRHVRLVDYSMHEGHNARAILCVDVEAPMSINGPSASSGGTPFITTIDANGQSVFGPVVTPTELSRVAEAKYEHFEAVETRHLVPERNLFQIYTYGDALCCLPLGSTHASLWHDTIATDLVPLATGDIIVFEEVKGRSTGLAADADPLKRHAVRLTSVHTLREALRNVDVIEVEWAQQDALPFELCLSLIGPAPECELIGDVTIVRGNTVVVDQGRTLPTVDLGQVPLGTLQRHCRDVQLPTDPEIMPGRFQPTLSEGALAYQEPFATDSPVAALLRPDPRRAVPAGIRVWSMPNDGITALPGDESVPTDTYDWEYRVDLLDSSATDRHFCIETNNHGVASLRFGDGELGRQPEANSRFFARYRVSNASLGNVGADSIVHMLATNDAVPVLRIRNPLPSRGGVDPESVDVVRELAASAPLRVLERAITPLDYQHIAENDPDVQRAHARFSFTGAHVEVQVALDILERATVRPGIATVVSRVQRKLEAVRRMGHDVRVQAGQAVGIELVLRVCVRPGFVANEVRAALLGKFSNRSLGDSTLGFFHPDRLTFGEPIRVSQVVANAQAVAGVSRVEVLRLRRFGDPDRMGADGKALPDAAIAGGVLTLGSFQIPRLDNDPSAPERGRLAIIPGGGR